MAVNIDKIDKKILHYLIENCRYPNSYIAKNLNISNPLLKYRIDKLEKAGIIETYGTDNMMNALGFFRYYKIFLKIKKTRPAEKKAIIEYLKSSPLISRVFECEGIWNLGFHVASALQNDIKPIIDNVQRLSKGYLEDLKIFNISHCRTLQRQFFCENVDDLHIKSNLAKSGASFNKELKASKGIVFHGVAKFDDLDLKLLKLIKNKARMPLTTLAKKLNCNLQTVKSRISNLVKKGIILGFTIQIDYEKLGFKETVVLFSVLTEEKYQEEIRKYVEHNFPSVYFVFGYLDYWNMAFVVHSKNQDYVDNMIDDVLNKFRDRISDFTKLKIIKNEKNKLYDIDLDKVYTDALNLLESR